MGATISAKLWMVGLVGNLKQTDQINIANTLISLKYSEF